MNAITCCCAPAPIDSIATTAATPKIMPSMVSSVRSLWRSRLSTLRPRSGSQRTDGHRAARCGAGGAVLARLPDGVFGIDERHFRRLLDVLDDGDAVGPRRARGLRARRSRRRVRMYTGRPAAHVEHRRARDVEHVVVRLPGDRDGRRHAGRTSRIGR